MKKKLSFLLLLAICMVASAKGPKYVFYFIGDGMGMNQVTSTEYFLANTVGNKPGYASLAFTQFPYSGMAVTISANSYVTDSSAAGTALATGQKTNNQMLGMLPDRKTSVESIAEKAHKKGVRVAIGTTVCIDHATPGSFYGHQVSREMYHQIGIQLAESGFEFFGGADFHTPFQRGVDDEGNYVQAEKAGYVITHGYDEYKANRNADKVILFDKNPKDDHYLSFAIDRKPGDLTLEEITTAAIDFMMKEPKKGFFMMMEGGKIDQACHGNDAATSVQEVIDFDKAIQVAIEFYKKHPKETLIVITADHETGAMGLSNGQYSQNPSVLQYQKASEGEFSKILEEMGKKKGEILTFDEVEDALKEYFGFGDQVKLTQKQSDRLRTAYVEALGMGQGEKKAEEYYKVDKLSDLACEIMSEIAQISWGTGSHSGAMVPIFSMGVGAEQFSGILDNTEIPMRIAKLAGY